MVPSPVKSTAWHVPPPIHRREGGDSKTCVSQNTRSKAQCLGLGCKDTVQESSPTFKGIEWASTWSHHNDRLSQALTEQILGLLSRTHCAQGGHHCLERREDKLSAFLGLWPLNRPSVEMRKLPEPSKATSATASSTLQEQALGNPSKAGTCMWVSRLWLKFRPDLKVILPHPPPALLLAFH